MREPAPEKSEQVDIEEYEIEGAILRILLADRSSEKNILWATDDYAHLGESYESEKEIAPELIASGNRRKIITPRVLKPRHAQAVRTKARAEVFTPSWICNRINNYADRAWFGRDEVFNREIAGDGGNAPDWEPVPEKISRFPKGKTWEDYVASRRLEITCGEAPFLASRYDTTTGKFIRVKRRIGLLDRKLRLVSENCADPAAWAKWATRALQSVYGYEWQGDNLLLAREALYFSTLEHFREKFGDTPLPFETKLAFAEIVSWNLWQMDGLNAVVPLSCHAGVPAEGGGDSQLFLRLPGFEPASDSAQTEICAGCLRVDIALHDGIACKIKKWTARGNASSPAPFKFSELMMKKQPKARDTGPAATKPRKKMKFDFVIGNPPYQDSTIGENDTFAPPIYHKFMDEAFAVGEKILLIHPARFLFNAGATPKQWNRKMLNDAHFKVLNYEQDSGKIFANTDIKGGIAITVRDAKKKIGPVGTFTHFPELNSLLKKIESQKGESLMKLIYAAESYKFTEQMHKDHPEVEAMLSKGHKYDLKSSVIKKLRNIVFFDEKPKGNSKFTQVIGLKEKNERVQPWIKLDYIKGPENFRKYKVLLPSANGSGAIGEVLSTPLIGEPLIGEPLIGHTQTFLSIGAFNTRREAENCLKYIKSKFARAALGILKVTQTNPSPVWKYVPLQDFTKKSDIDWSVPAKEIDARLYEKYGLSKKEISFIESKVREMK